MSPEAADLIKKLLVLDHTKRLGANGAEEIKCHPFFNGVDWDRLRTQQAPIVPERKSEIDTSNFVRLGDKLKKKDQEDPFVFIPKDTNAVSNMVIFLLKKISDKEIESCKGDVGSCIRKLQHF